MHARAAHANQHSDKLVSFMRHLVRSVAELVHCPDAHLVQVCAILVHLLAFAPITHYQSAAADELLRPTRNLGDVAEVGSSVSVL
jgi:hypothetical protein